MYKLVARNPLHFNLLSTLPEFLIDHNQVLFEVSYTVSQYLMTWDLIAVRQEVNNLESSVVVQELEFVINLALWSFVKFRSLHLMNGNHRQNGQNVFKGYNGMAI